jgi:hypothetical protein
LAPGAGSNRVIVLDLFATDFVPLGPLGVEVVNVETVKVAHDAGLPGRVERGASEFLDLLVF